jgi:hypothetical protein
MEKLFKELVIHFNPQKIALFWTKKVVLSCRPLVHSFFHVPYITTKCDKYDLNFWTKLMSMVKKLTIHVLLVYIDVN